MGIERLSQAALAELLEGAPDGIVLVCDDGIIEYVNRAAEELFGYSRDELAGVVVERLVPGRLRARHVGDRTAYAECPRPRPMGLGLRLQGLRRDGSEVPVEISLAPLELEGRRMVMATVRNATEQRKLEEERTRYAQAHAVEEIVAALDVIVWESPTPGRELITYLGGRDEMLLGYPRARWLEPGFWTSVVHPEDRVVALSFVEAARERETFELHYRMVAADGRVRDVRDIVTAARGPEGTIERLRGVITDVTEQQSVVAQLKHAQKMEAVGQLAGGIAHDFNNLLTIVSGYARRLAARPELASAHADVQQILEATERAGELTQRLLTFARRGETGPTPLSVDEVVADLEPMLRRLLAADIVMELDLTPALPAVTMDRTALEQIVMNLVLNASDAMPTGGTLQVATSSATVAGDEAEGPGDGAGQFVRLAVTDTGSGVPAEIRDRIFEPFFTTKGERRTGMGLAAVYGAAEQAGGWVELESEQGRGSTFTVVLPASAAPQPSAGADRPTTILLVEDEPALRTLVTTMLEDEGYAVLTAGDGYEAIEVAERDPARIDLLVSDIVMPRLSGPDLARRIRELRPDLEVLFMSGYNDSRLVSRGVKECEVHLLVKPFTPDQLITRVQELTGGTAQRAG